MAKTKTKKTAPKKNPEKEVVAENATPKVAKEPKVRSKLYLEKKAATDRNKFYSSQDAVELVKQVSYSKFPGIVELHLTVKKENLSTSVTLPYSTGKTRKIEVASAETIEKLTQGKVDFDLLLATADMMPKLVPFAKLLGPKGLMPNPKNGTIIKDAKEADKFLGNTMTIKTEKKAPLIHTIIGKVDQADSELLANLEAIFKGVGKNQVLKAYLKPTMGPSVKLAIV